MSPQACDSRSGCVLSCVRCREMRSGVRRGNLSVALHCFREVGATASQALALGSVPWRGPVFSNDAPCSTCSSASPSCLFFYPLVAFSSCRVVTLRALLKGLPVRRVARAPLPVCSPALPFLPLQTAGCCLLSSSAPSRSAAQLPPQEPCTLTAARTLRSTATALTPDSGVHYQKEKRFSQFEIGQDSHGCCYKLMTRPSGDPAIRVTVLPVLQPSSPPLYFCPHPNKNKTLEFIYMY